MSLVWSLSLQAAIITHHRWYINRNIFFTVLEARNPRSWSWSILLLRWKHFPGLQTTAFLPLPHMRFSVWVCVSVCVCVCVCVFVCVCERERERERERENILSGVWWHLKGPYTLMTLLNLSYFHKGPISKYHYTVG